MRDEEVAARLRDVCAQIRDFEVAIKELSDEHRELVRQLRDSGLLLKEIAEGTGITLARISQIVHGG